MTTITLSNLNDATAQDVFNQVVTHLVKQGVKSGRYEEDGSYGCYYRHPEDNTIKCAAGCLISDEEYNFYTMDSRTLNCTNWRELAHTNVVPSGHISLISSLQEIHDTKCDGYCFKLDDFEHIAKEYSLQLPEIVDVEI